MNKPINEWMNEWMNEWINRSINDIDIDMGKPGFVDHFLGEPNTFAIHISTAPSLNWCCRLAWAILIGDPTLSRHGGLDLAPHVCLGNISIYLYIYICIYIYIHTL